MAEPRRHCDFCGKAQDEVQCLVHSSRANICDACVRLSVETIERFTPSQGPAESRTPSAPPADTAKLAVLERIEAILVRWDKDGLPSSRVP